MYQKNKLLKLAKNIPDHPGVYFWLDKDEKILYIGKATSLKFRLLNYFRSDLEPSKQQMVCESVNIKFELTDTTLEALMLENKYIKKFKPKFNVVQKDDKSMAFLAISKEEYPRLFILRARVYERYLTKDPKITQKYKIKKVYGPFLTADIINKVLKLIMPIFSYRICNNPPHIICLYGRLGQCPLHKKPQMTIQQYNKNLEYIGKIFQGKMPSLVKKLHNEMQDASKQKKFEIASVIRDQLFALKHINDIALIDEYQDDTEIPARLEAYDISHFGGKQAVGAFVVFEGGKPEKSQYRKFIIRGKYTQDDTKMLEEVLTRRLNHNEWILPDFILLDGGITQLNIAKKVLNKLKLDIVLVASAKGQNRKKTDLLWNDEKDIKKFNQKKLLQLIKSAQAEVHRFVISFQKKRRILI